MGDLITFCFGIVIPWCIILFIMSFVDWIDAGKPVRCYFKHHWHTIRQEDKKILLPKYKNCGALVPADNLFDYITFDGYETEFKCCRCGKTKTRSRRYPDPGDIL